jgi:hypothetical protein
MYAHPESPIMHSQMFTGRDPGILTYRSGLKEHVASKRKKHIKVSLGKT